jgi:hypothetical protein
MRVIYLSSLIITLIFIINAPLNGQLRLGNVNGEINFREGPGSNFRVLHTVNKSNLLVILPREPQNGYIEVFDIETSSWGYVYESLIRITDTLTFSKQNFFEKTADSTSGSVEMELINSTSHTLFFWINKFSYNISPFEKKVLVIGDEDIIYFSSAPGLFPVFGREVLKKGSVYVWKFTQ